MLRMFPFEVLNQFIDFHEIWLEHLSTLHSMRVSVSLFCFAVGTGPVYACLNQIKSRRAWLQISVIVTGCYNPLRLKSADAEAILMDRNIVLISVSSGAS
jgi:hypothetical protein